MTSAHYEIRVAGTVPPEVMLDFDQLHASAEPAETMIYGLLPDQAALCGLLTRLETLGARVLAVHRLQGGNSQRIAAAPLLRAVPRYAQRGTVIETQTCEWCGAIFTPRREHVRFCSSCCRAAWNRVNASGRAVQLTALVWSITAMGEATGQLRSVRAWDQPRAFFGLISEAVWWVTIVDSTLVRYHLDTYDHVLADRAPAKRQLAEGTLAGLRFVRNQMGQYIDHADFIDPGRRGSGAGDGRITAWTWKPLAEPALASLPARGRTWEMTRYRAYGAHLAGHTVGQVFGRAVPFLELAAAKATSVTDASAGTAR